MHQDGCFWGKFYFRNIPQWLLLKGSCKDRFILEIRKGRIFMNVFLSEGFGEKCKHSELALNFIEKQYFSYKAYFPFITLK